MNTNTPTNVAVAPRIGEQGTSTPGGHYVLYRAQGNFAPTAKLALTDTINHWRPNTPGARFWEGALSKAATVAEAITKGAECGIKATEVQKHLRWYYTWGYLQVDGVVFAAPTKPAKEPVAKPVTPKAKGKPAKVS